MAYEVLCCLNCHKYIVFCQIKHAFESNVTAIWNCIKICMYFTSMFPDLCRLPSLYSLLSSQLFLKICDKLELLFLAQDWTSGVDVFGEKLFISAAVVLRYSYSAMYQQSTYHFFLSEAYLLERKTGEETVKPWKYSMLTSRIIRCQLPSMLCVGESHCFVSPPSPPQKGWLS